MIFVLLHVVPFCYILLQFVTCNNFPKSLNNKWRSLVLFQFDCWLLQIVSFCYSLLHVTTLFSCHLCLILSPVLILVCYNGLFNSFWLFSFFQNVIFYFCRGSSFLFRKWSKTDGQRWSDDGLMGRKLNTERNHFWTKVAVMSSWPLGFAEGNPTPPPSPHNFAPPPVAARLPEWLALVFRQAGPHTRLLSAADVVADAWRSCDDNSSMYVETHSRDTMPLFSTYSSAFSDSEWGYARKFHRRDDDLICCWCWCWWWWSWRETITGTAL